MKKSTIFKVLRIIFIIIGFGILLWASWKILIGIFFIQLATGISTLLRKEKNKSNFDKLYENLLNAARPLSGK